MASTKQLSSFLMQWETDIIHHGALCMDQFPNTVSI